MPRRRLVRVRYRPVDLVGGEDGAGSSAAVAPPGSPGTGPYKCDIAECAKEFARWKEVKRHRRSHASDKPHRCTQCSLSFNMEFNLTLHRATHNADSLECPECHKKFSRVASLKSHIIVHQKDETLICPECGDEFGLQKNLDEHLQGHAVEIKEPKEHLCRNCEEKFPMHYMLKEHMRQKHKPKFRSAIMNTKFTRRVLDRSRFHHGCTFCGKSFPKPSQLERHIRIHTGEKPYKCAHCDKAFNQNGALVVHMSKHTGSKPFTCEFCGQKFAQRGNLRAHIVRVHEINSELAQRYECPQCCCNFRKMSSLNAHISRFHNSDEVSNPLLSLKAALSALQEGADWLDSTVDTSALAAALEQLILMLEQNMNEGETLNRIHELMMGNDIINTDILQQALENSGVSGSLEEGQKHDQNIPLVAEDSVSPETSLAPVATINQRVQETPVAQEAPVSSVAPEAAAPVSAQLTQLFSFVTEILQRRVTMKQTSPTGARLHSCNYCTKTFKKPSDLVRHTRIHTNEKPYRCQQCDKSFTVKSTLMSHMKTHAGIKDYKCNECNKMFATHGSLKIHLRLHTGAKPFECQHCDKKFRTTGQRKVHMHAHFKDPAQRKARSAQMRSRNMPDIDLSDIPLQEPILITDTGLIQQPPRNSGMYNSYLSDGLHQSGPTNERPYHCSFCNKCFKKSSHLKQHVRSHTGERPYQCVTCLRSFISSGVLRAHERTHIGIKSYKCMICDCSFTTNGSLKRHMSTHTDVRPFMCPYCQKTFKTSVNCKKHMKMHKRELALQAKQQENDPNHVQEIQSIAEQASNLAEQLSVEALAIAQGQLSVTQEALNAQTALTEANLATQALAQQNLSQGNLITDGLTHEALSQNYAHAFSQQTLDSITNSQGDLTAENQISLQTQQIQQQLEAITGQSASLFSQPTTIHQVQEDLARTGGTASLQTNSGSVFTTADTEKRAYPCHFCEKTFKKSSHLKQHIRSHTGEKPCKCMTCGRSFVSPGVLKNHMRIHTGVKGFRCNICESYFTTNGSLVRHMNIHTDQRPHQCSQCGEGFRKVMDLKRHTKEHAAESDEEEEEGEDGKRLKTVIQFNEEEAQQIAKKPLARNASNSERILVQMVNDKNRVSEVLNKEEELERRPQFPNKCNHCTKSFKKPCDLVRHIRTHTGEKPFKCTDCERTFAVKSTLVCHMRTHKGGKQETCHICKTTFATVGSLKVHMRLHTGAKPFKCKHCNERFRTSGSRKQHMENHFKPSAIRKRKATEKAAANKENATSEEVDVAESSQAELMQQQSPQVHVPETSQDSIVAEQSVLQTIASSQQASTIGSLQEVPANDPGAPTVLTGLELQLNGTSLGQSLQIHGLDGSNITVQIDPSLLQQLQQLQQHNAVTLQTGELNLGQASLQLSQPDVSSLIGGQEVTLQQGIQNGIDPQTGFLVQMDPSTLHQVPQMIRIDTGLPNQQAIHVQTPSTATSTQQQQVILQNSGLQNIMSTIQNQNALISNAIGVPTQQNIVSSNSVATFLQGGDVPIAMQDALSHNVSQTESAIANSMYTLQTSDIQTSDRGSRLVQTETSTSQSGGTGLNQSFQLNLSADQLALHPNIILQQPSDQSAVDFVTSTSNVIQPQEQVTISSGSLVESSEPSTTVTVNVVDLTNLTTQGNMQTAAGGSNSAQLQEEEDSDEDDDDEEEEELEEGSDEDFEFDNPVVQGQGPMLADTRDLRAKRPLSAKAAAAAIGSIYPCTVQGCNEVFTKMQHLSQHQQDKHKSLRPHSCNVCGKSFKRPGHLRDHMTTHTSSERRKGERRSAGGAHLCLTCGKSFTKPSQLQRHTRTHTGEKPYSCPECFKSFSQKNSLQIHMNVHTKERPHKCPHCLTAFTQKGNLKTHLARSHKLGTDPMAHNAPPISDNPPTEELDIEKLFAT